MTVAADRDTTVDPAVYRHVIGHFATGVAVITTANQGEFYGMTANAISSVSLDPVLLLVCFDKRARTGQAVRDNGRFVINILDETQHHLAVHFSRPGNKNTAPMPLEYGDDGLPRLSGALAYLTCVVYNIVPAGDHEIVLGEVEECHAATGRPLLYYRGDYHTLDGGR